MECRTCKFWRAPTDQFDETWRGDFGKCDQTPHAEDVGEWDENMIWGMSSEYKDRTATVQDASGYMATLYTKPEHFCAMFSA